MQNILLSIPSFDKNLKNLIEFFDLLDSKLILDSKRYSNEWFKKKY